MSVLAGVLKLLERQLGLWELKRRLADMGKRPGRYMEGHVAYGPCLLVSRERGSGGSRIAVLVAEQLGWHVFDREIVDEIAQLTHAREQLLNSLDKETRSHVEGTWRPELKPSDIGYEKYLRGLRQVVLTLGHHGDVVLLGRGAQFLLPAQCALRVRVVAPLDLRVRRVVETDKVPAAEAQAHVQGFDSDQADFIQKCFQSDANSALNYDLIVNTGEISIQGAAGIVLSAMRDKFGMQPPRK